MDDDLYDEFGNYIGPQLNDSDDDDDNSSTQSPVASSFRPSESMDEDPSPVERDGVVAAGSSAIVLHEDKQNYPDANDVYPDAEVIVQDEDTQALEQPIIAPIKVAKFTVVDKKMPKMKHSDEFVGATLQNRSLLRNVAVVGHLHHGKTTLVDVFVEHTQQDMWNPNLNMRFCDTRIDEQSRKLSIKSTPITMILPDSTDKHYAINLVDCPGHVNFCDEAVAGVRVSDGVVVVVDAVEGVLMNTKRMIKYAAEAAVPITLCITKMDRLVHELKLPPGDAYFKLLNVIEHVNSVIETSVGEDASNARVSPELGNVCFASGVNGWCFTLESFARLYVESHGMRGMDAFRFSRRLWGDVYHDESNGKFKTRAPFTGASRTFVHFILEPLYKIYSQVLGEEPHVLKNTLTELGVKVTSKQLQMDAKPLLKLVFSQFFGNSSGFVDMLVNHVPSPLEAAKNKVTTTYTGNLTTPLCESMVSCDPNGPLMIQIVKLYSKSEQNATTNSFDAFGRILSGTIVQGQEVRILGEAYSLDDDEDMAVRAVTSIAIPQGRYRLDVDRASAGSWVLLGGIDACINKTATVVDVENTHDAEIFKPLQFNSEAIVKLSVEPLNPSELPKMLAALRSINKSYPMSKTKVEESGEHIIYGTGEMYMDCIMHDLRELHSDVEVKVADPVVAFTETVIETSALKCYAETPNKRNKITMISEPLEKGLAEDIERGNIVLNWEKRKVQDFFMNQYDWDLLAARSIWAFGPDANGPNALLDDTLPSEVDKKLLGSVRESIVQGFQWGCREGPLCDEPIRNVKFKVLDASLASEPIHRGGGQIIPTARRVAYSSFLVATPRLMEPIFAVEIQAPADMVTPVYNVLSRRRGHVVSDAPIPGSPFYLVRGYIPVIDSFGFETDLRAHTQGLAFVLQEFDHWSVVPGDPLDTSVVLRPLEPSPPIALAREFMVKTRRRKGLSEDVSIDKYFDDPRLLEMVKRDVVQQF